MFNDVIDKANIINDTWPRGLHERIYLHSRWVSVTCYNIIIECHINLKLTDNYHHPTWNIRRVLYIYIYNFIDTSRQQRCRTLVKYQSDVTFSARSSGFETSRYLLARRVTDEPLEFLIHHPMWLVNFIYYLFVAKVFLFIMSRWVSCSPVR